MTSTVTKTTNPAPLLVGAWEKANEAARQWLYKAEDKAPPHVVLSNGKIVGTMLDLCGNSYLQFMDSRKAHARLFKRHGLTSDSGTLILRHSYKHRQESGLHKAAMRAALEYLTAQGVEGLCLHSYID